MSVERVGWLGVRTDRFEQMVSLYRDLLGLDVFHVDGTSVRFRLGDGTEVHVYGQGDVDHEFFGSAPVVGLVVDDVASVRERMEAAGIEFLTPVEHAGPSSWCHFRGPDGNVYEIISRGHAEALAVLPLRFAGRASCVDQLQAPKFG